MRFNINFVIHIFEHPMYIVRNFDNPRKELHLSYHEGQHYNSVRLIGDDGETIPKKISLESLGLMGSKIQSTTEFIDYDLINDNINDTKDQTNIIEEDEEIDDDLRKAIEESKLELKKQESSKEFSNNNNNTNNIVQVNNDNNYEINYDANNDVNNAEENYEINYDVNYYGDNYENINDYYDINNLEATNNDYNEENNTNTNNTNNIIDLKKQVSNNEVEINTNSKVNTVTTKVIEEVKKSEPTTENKKEIKPVQINIEYDKDNLVYNNYIIKSILEVPRGKLDKKIIIHLNGEMIDELGDFKKCHCTSNKKYKNCCKNEDIMGSIDGEYFYCDIDKFISSKAFEIMLKQEQDKNKAETEGVNQNGTNANVDISDVTKKMKQIFI